MSLLHSRQGERVIYSVAPSHDCVEEATLEMTSLVKTLATTYPDTNGDFEVATVEPVADLQAVLVEY